MTLKEQYIALQTILWREISRLFRIAVQTIVPPVMTMTLYFIIFGNLIGSRIGTMDGFNYMQYIAPGLIMMSVINSAYSNTVASFFGARFQKNIEEMLVSPMPNYILLLGHVLGGVARGLVVGALVTVLTLFFTKLTVHHLFITIGSVFFSALLFSLAGFTNAVFAKNFDDISYIPTFVITPLTYLGGVFYSINLLPPFWRELSKFNPILYMVNAFRYGILGVSDVKIGVALSIIILFVIGLFWVNLTLLNKGVRIKE